ncbi:hypothetical protein Tbd_2773 [Thiobacillus denitrificans ATCC 25259]|uniref:Uncharacterized protein n=1 Tax=Thiobacillus denitrificans (strain ATCC 25259 / T1) TaxID=292415 RepID=Q3SF88_THIDA|nr:hypothetical protein Tbd_2773 [Thiobacillus denitrificans ATCC 25259]
MSECKMHSGWDTATTVPGGFFNLYSMACGDLPRPPAKTAPAATGDLSRCGDTPLRDAPSACLYGGFLSAFCDKRGERGFGTKKRGAAAPRDVTN